MNGTPARLRRSQQPRLQVDAVVRWWNIYAGELGRKPWVELDRRASSDMPSGRWPPSLARSCSSRPDRSLTCLAPPGEASARAGARMAQLATGWRRCRSAVARRRRRAEQLRAWSRATFSTMSTYSTAGVEAAADGALGVFVGQHAAHGLQHCGRGRSFRGDHLQRIALVGKFFAGRSGDARVDGLDDL